MGLKGKTNNPNGRPKGSSNHNLAKLRFVIEKLVDDNLENIKDDIKVLEPKDRIKIIIDLLQYVVPKLQATQLNIGDEAKSKFESMLDGLCDTKGGGNGNAK